ncbi:MAG TPA: hypothetical protein VFW62_08090, partial [bacterium]|nr:hypothetical protein [bacterium]
MAILVCVISLYASPEPVLKQRLKAAKSGDYIVTEAGKMVTVLAIRSNQPTSLVIEEISVPLHNLKERPASWAEW